MECCHRNGDEIIRLCSLMAKTRSTHGQVILLNAFIYCAMSRIQSRALKQIFVGAYISNSVFKEWDLVSTCHMKWGGIYKHRAFDEIYVVNVEMINIFGASNIIIPSVQMSIENNMCNLSNFAFH